MSDRRKFLQQALLPAGTLYLSSLLPSRAQARVQGPPGTAAAGEGGYAIAGKAVPGDVVKTGEPASPKGFTTPADPSLLSQRLKSITRTTVWKPVDPIKVLFKTFHCQGMVKIGNDFWVSSVEIEIPAGGTFDWRKGRGHLFKIDPTGNLVADIPVGEGTMYHPSGIDFDGRHIWIATAEYRPDSQAIVYKFDPAGMKLEEMFRWQDHIGGILRNPDTNTLHGISWGSRRFYEWQLDKTGKVMMPAGAAKESAKGNSSFYIDYQDNQYLGGNEIVYTGLSVYKKPDGSRMAIGGLEIVDPGKQVHVHQVPVELWSPVTGAPITQNPSFFELAGDKVRAYFMPDDNDSTIFIYEA